MMSPTLAARRARRVLYIFIAVGVVLLLMLLGYALAAIRTTQLEGTPTGQKLLVSADRILECTEPQGECYKRNQEATRKAVGDINRVIVLAAACSVGLDETLTTREREVRIQACVISRLSEEVP